MERTVPEALTPLPEDDFRWQCFPEVLSRGCHLDDDGMLILHEPAWWGVSIDQNYGPSLVYAVRATSNADVLDKISAELTTTGQASVSLAHLHSDSSIKNGQTIRIHETLDQRHPDRDVVRVNPFSIDEYQESAAAS